MHNDKKYQIEKAKEEFNLCSLDTKLEFASYLVTTLYYHLLSIAILFSEENSEVLNFFPTKPQINVQTLTFPKMAILNSLFWLLSYIKRIIVYTMTIPLLFTYIKIWNKVHTRFFKGIVILFCMYPQSIQFSI